MGKAAGYNSDTWGKCHVVMSRSKYNPFKVYKPENCGPTDYPERTIEGRRTWNRVNRRSGLKRWFDSIPVLVQAQYRRSARHAMKQLIRQYGADVEIPDYEKFIAGRIAWYY